ncbi:hypothetical protein [Sphingopyxis granuli]|uniref:hypothetical protein n=1 Tax=Sphingopyxis granuli TaxID=267128 RepID=UPI00301D5855
MSDRPANGVRTLSYRAALREALIEEMQRDERVFMMGPDPRFRLHSGFPLAQDCDSSCWLFGGRHGWIDRK